MDDTKKPKRSEVMKFLRKLPKGKRRAHSKLGPLAKLRRKRQKFIAESQRQGVEQARLRREGYLARNLTEGLTIAIANGHPL